MLLSVHIQYPTVLFYRLALARLPPFSLQFSAWVGKSWWWWRHVNIPGNWLCITETLKVAFSSGDILSVNGYERRKQSSSTFENRSISYSTSHSSGAAGYWLAVQNAWYQDMLVSCSDPWIATTWYTQRGREVADSGVNRCRAYGR